MGKVNGKISDTRYLLISFAIAAASQVLRLISATAANVFSFALFGVGICIVTYWLLKRKNTVQEWLAWMIGLAGIAGAIACGSLLNNGATATAIILLTALALVGFFAARLIKSNGANWWYNLAGIIGFAGAAAWAVSATFLNGVVATGYLTIIPLVGVFFAAVAADRGQKIEAATQKQIEPGYGEKLKKEPIKERVKQRL